MAVGERVVLGSLLVGVNGNYCPYCLWHINVLLSDFHRYVTQTDLSLKTGKLTLTGQNDAVAVFARYATSVAVCRIVVAYELSGLRATIRVVEETESPSE